MHHLYNFYLSNLLLFNSFSKIIWTFIVFNCWLFLFYHRHVHRNLRLTDKTITLKVQGVWWRMPYFLSNSLWVETGIGFSGWRDGLSDKKLKSWQAKNTLSSFEFLVEFRIYWHRYLKNYCDYNNKIKNIKTNNK